MASVCSIDVVLSSLDFVGVDARDELFMIDDSLMFDIV
ncbi:hypothetical protein A2U01_0061352, partial [Trifolium medium]|nr:hypothetical protein [Trifolium medium]